MQMTEQQTLLSPRDWVKNHADYLYAFAITRLNDEEQAKDLVQETFLAALQKVGGFQGKSSERTWLTAILKNKIIDTYRKKSSGLKQVELTVHEPDQEFFDTNDGHWKKEHWPMPFGVEQHDPLHNKEFNHVLQQCMQKLPALWLSVFTLKHLDDATSESICAEMKISPNNFWVIIHRAKLNLRACLQKNWI
jgi:RNA polymerase sigma-70 factor (TIGR02943 family)